MAEKEELDLDEGKKSSGKKKLIIISIIAAILLVGGSVGLTVMLLGGDSRQGTDEAVDEVEEVVIQPPIYMPLEKVVVNFTDRRSPARYLQIELQLMSRSQLVLDAVNAHMPVIRNDILVLLGSQKYEDVSSVEGKNALRQQILEHIRQILGEHTEIPPEGLEEIYFTTFVMQ